MMITEAQRAKLIAKIDEATDAALIDIIRDAIRAGGDEPEASEVKAIIDDAEDLLPADLSNMVTTLELHGDRFTGNNVEDEAQGWIDAGFDADAADDWCEVGVWDADTAKKFRGAELTPDQVKAAAESLVEDLDDATEVYTDGDPIYSVCNGDTSAQVIIDAAQ